MRITRRLEFDAGHRIPNHESCCRHLHGHRYALEVTVSGPLTATEGAPHEGMVADFSDIKATAEEFIVDRWDHAFLACRTDAALLTFLESMPDHRTVIFDAPPTAEHLAVTAFRILDVAYRERCRGTLRLERVRVYETPNCWADAVRGEV